MRIRMKMTVAGTFYNNPEGVRVGDIVDIDTEHALAFIESGRAERADQRGEEHAVLHSSEEEHAVKPKAVAEPVEKPVYGETHPPEDAPAPATKRGPGRPRKS